jgi:hypothetical protein
LQLALSLSRFHKEVSDGDAEEIRARCAVPDDRRLKWGIVGLTGGETNVLSDIFGTGTLDDVVYVVIGVAGLVYIPRLLDALHIGAGPHPRGA